MNEEAVVGATEVLDGNPPARWRLPRWASRPALWLFVVLVALTAPSVVTEQRNLLDASSGRSLLAWPFLAGYIVVIAVVLRWGGGQVTTRWAIPLSIAWGAIVAVGLSGSANDAWLEAARKTFGAETAARIVPLLEGPVWEEGFKLAGVVLLALVVPATIRGPRSGFVVGALVGLGFAVVESAAVFGVLASVLPDANALTLGVDRYVLTSASAVVLMHPLATGIGGAGVGWFIARRSVRAALGFALLGVLVHAGWNGLVAATAGDLASPAAPSSIGIRVGLLAALALVVVRLPPNPAANDRVEDGLAPTP